MRDFTASASAERGLMASARSTASIASSGRCSIFSVFASATQPSSACGYALVNACNWGNASAYLPCATSCSPALAARPAGPAAAAGDDDVCDGGGGGGTYRELPGGGFPAALMIITPPGTATR